MFTQLADPMGSETELRGIVYLFIYYYLYLSPGYLMKLAVKYINSLSSKYA